MADDIAYKPLGEQKKIYAGGGLTPPNFMPSYYEFLKLKGQDVRGNAAKVAAVGYATIYTKPDGYTLFLTGYNITAAALHEQLQYGEVILYIADHPTNPKYSIAGIFLDTSGQGADTTQVCSSVARDFKYPIKIEEKYLTIYNGDIRMGGRIHITGFLVKNTDFPAV